jgi:hypothetical protein
MTGHMLPQLELIPIGGYILEPTRSLPVQDVQELFTEDSSHLNSPWGLTWIMLHGGEYLCAASISLVDRMESALSYNFKYVVNISLGRVATYFFKIL